ncbi:RNA polymerase sporulation sigma factor SigH [Effusibacillus dendaii]|uniref:RNA polymerase sigma factor SigS n=1 Tax=Effusibacillus dendaii TaxID=2743772 RepID=A0A7I8D8V3_9BACL|nr:RNA polymerase sporulation sigma factor SigH [Effusibacillus dendaii]BCJ85429.1 RNA polymerase sporulation sigma factor SigH [Effusibacillus dendaii]
MTHLEAGNVEEEIVLAQQGNAQSVERVLSQFQPYVRLRARSFFLAGAEYEDLVQEGMIGLYKAIRDYRREKEIPFRVFAEICITRQIITAIKTARRLKHQPLNQYLSLYGLASDDESNRSLLDTIPSPHGNEPDEMIIHQEQLIELQLKLRKILSSFEYQVLSLHAEGHSYKEIATLMNSSTKAIDNALYRIKRKMDGHHHLNKAKMSS